jgi:hypothetical protein
MWWMRRPISCPKNPPGVQLATTTRPPGRRTRASSAAATFWRGANITPNVDSTRSKLASSNGSASASPSIHSIVTSAAAARSRAASKSSGVRSSPVTSAPACAARIAALPVPVATSRTVIPGSIPAASTTTAPTSQKSVAIAS